MARQNLGYRCLNGCADVDRCRSWLCQSTGFTSGKQRDETGRESQSSERESQAYDRQPGSVLVGHHGRMIPRQTRATPLPQNLKKFRDTTPTRDTRHGV